MILLFFDGTPESMNGILQEFDFFAYISGLIIHFLKAKIIWIEILFFKKKCFIIQNGSLSGKVQI